MSYRLLLALLLVGTFAYAAPAPAPKTPADEMNQRLLDMGFQGRVKPLRFELDQWAADTKVSQKEIEDFDPTLAKAIWKGDDKKPKSKSDLLALPLDADQSHLLALAARLKAEDILGDAKKTEAKLVEWRKEETDALFELVPHATLKDLGLPKAALDKIIAEGKDDKPKPFADLKLSEIAKDPKGRERLEKILASLPLADQIKLQAALDKKVEGSHDSNVGPSRYARMVDRVRKQVEKERGVSIKPPPRPGAGRFRNNGGGGHGVGAGSGGAPGKAPEAPIRRQCDERPKTAFTKRLEEERGKPMGDRINRPLDIQHLSEPGVAGLCGSSVLDDDAPACTIDIVTAAHCTLSSVDGQGAYERTPNSDLVLHVKGFTNLAVEEVHYPPPFDSAKTGQIKQDIVVIRARAKECRETIGIEKVRLAHRPPHAGESVMIHMNSRMMTNAGCSPGGCNGGILAATINGQEFVPPQSRHEVDLRDRSCNELTAKGGDINSIQPGISGSPAVNIHGELVGVNSTKSVFENADGHVGSIGDAVTFIQNQLGIRSPEPEGYARLPENEHRGPAPTHGI